MRRFAEKQLAAQLSPGAIRNTAADELAVLTPGNWLGVEAGTC